MQQQKYKSVNEQLHYQKEVMYKIIFDLITLHFQNNPTAAPTIQMLFQTNVLNKS